MKKFIQPVFEQFLQNTGKVFYFCSIFALGLAQVCFASVSYKEIEKLYSGRMAVSKISTADLVEDMPAMTADGSQETTQSFIRFGDRVAQANLHYPTCATLVAADIDLVKQIIDQNKAAQEVLGCLPCVYHVKMAKKIVDLGRIPDAVHYMPVKDLYVRALRMVENGKFIEAKKAEHMAQAEMAKIPELIRQEQEKEDLIQKIENEMGKIHRPEYIRTYVEKIYSNGHSLVECIYRRIFTKDQLQEILKKLQRLHDKAKFAKIYN
ncbi:MAG TPA: hypothetical protein VLG50_02495 [Candidatus Saccharimonadales bacterium]|nr:hypothetical protein [Candidatus Saccharimonadales bacterium]